MRRSTFCPEFHAATRNEVAGHESPAQPAGGKLDTAAQKYDATPSQVALAWLLHRSKVMLPIPGTSSVKHLEENAAGAALKLDDTMLAGLGQR